MRPALLEMPIRGCRRACEAVTTCWIHADRPGCAHNKSRAGGEGPRSPTAFLRNVVRRDLAIITRSGRKSGRESESAFAFVEPQAVLNPSDPPRAAVPTWSPAHRCRRPAARDSLARRLTNMNLPLIPRACQLQRRGILNDVCFRENDTQLVEKKMSFFLTLKSLHFLTFHHLQKPWRQKQLV